MRILAVSLLILSSTWQAQAAVQTDGPPPDYLNHLSCRTASRSAGSSPNVVAITDVQLDTRSKRQEEMTIRAVLHNGQRLTAIVQHVHVRLPRDRFNITMQLDGKPHLRLNHVDLDTFAETTVDGDS